MVHEKILISIPANDFQAFDEGEQIIILESKKCLSGVNVDDSIHWECGQYQGIAKVMAISPHQKELVEITLLKET